MYFIDVPIMIILGKKDIWKRQEKNHLWRIHKHNTPNQVSRFVYNVLFYSEIKIFSMIHKCFITRNGIFLSSSIFMNSHGYKNRNKQLQIAISSIFWTYVDSDNEYLKYIQYESNHCSLHIGKMLQSKIIFEYFQWHLSYTYMQV